MAPFPQVMLRVRFRRQWNPSGEWKMSDWTTTNVQK